MAAAVPPLSLDMEPRSDLAASGNSTNNLPSPSPMGGGGRDMSRKSIRSEMSRILHQSTDIRLSPRPSVSTRRRSSAIHALAARRASNFLLRSVNAPPLQNGPHRVRINAPTTTKAGVAHTPRNSSGGSSSSRSSSSSFGSTSLSGSAFVPACCVGSCARFFKRPKGTAGLGLRSSSLFLFSGENRLRIFMFNITRSRPFEFIIILIIIANCVILALNDPTAESTAFQVNSDYFFVAAFSVEMVLKIFSQGFVLHDGAYLRSGWNVLDFVIVMISFVGLIPGIGNYTALRTLRVLRPLRSMNLIPALKTIVIAVLHSLKGLANVALLASIIFTVFGVVGVQLWQGNFRYRCQDTFTGEIFSDAFCTTSDVGTGFTGVECPAEQVCVLFENPGFGYTTFDNVLTAFLIVLQVITIEGWADIMHIAVKACGWYAIIYFIFLVLLGSYLILNLALAVINFEFEDAKVKVQKRMLADREEEEAELELLAEDKLAKARENLTSAGGINSATTSDTGGSRAPAINDISRPSPFKKTHIFADGDVNPHLGFYTTTQEAVHATTMSRTAPGRLLYSLEMLEDDERKQRRLDEQKKRDKDRRSRRAVEGSEMEARRKRRSSVHVSEPRLRADHRADRDDDAWSNAGDGGSERDEPPSPVATDEVIERAESEDEAHDEDGVSAVSSCCTAVRGWCSSRLSCLWGPFLKFRRLMFYISEGDPWEVHEFGIYTIKMELEELKRNVSKHDADGGVARWEDEEELEMLGGDHVVEEPSSTYFSKLIIICVILNTVLMAAEHYRQSDIQTTVSTALNTTFTSLFGLELVIRLFALGPIGYVSDPFNVFDGIITLMSLIELIFLSGSTFSILRVFRLLRILRLLNSFPSLKAIVEVIIVASKETFYLNVIFFLYLFVAALTGMQLFGGQYNKTDEETEALRSSFDNFYWSFYSVFQVATRDSWPDIMHDAMRFVSPAASLFFVICVFTGDFILLNLFLAILINSFDNLTVDTDDEKIKMIQQAKKKHRRGGAGGMGTLMTETSKRLLRLADHKLKVTEAEEGGGMQGVVNGFNRNPSSDMASSKLRAVKEKLAKKDEEDEGEETLLLGDKSIRLNTFDEMDDILQEEGEQGGRCLSCGEIKVLPFPPPSKVIVPLSADELHSRMCARISLRKAKREVIEELLAEIGMLSVLDDLHEEFNPVDLRELTAGMGLPTKTELSVVQGGDIPHLTIEGAMSAQSTSLTPPPTNPLDPAGAANRLRAELADFQFGRTPTPSSLLDGLTTPGGHSSNDSQYYPSSQFRRMQDAYIDAHEPTPSPNPELMDDLFGRAWEAGLLLNQNADDFYDIGDWEPLAVLLKTEAMLLELKVGEEQIGQSLVAYTRANIPTEYYTNGGTSLFLLGPRSKLRVWLTQLITNPNFDRAILVCIVVSSILMALDNPRNGEVAWLNVASNIFTSIFVVEACIKILALGFVFHNTAYLRDGWNVLDFAIVLISLVSWILESVINSSSLSALKVLRTLRALRPLRVINRYRGMKMVVSTLFLSIKGIANVSLIAFLVFLVFAILGVQLFAGGTYSCNDATIGGESSCIGSYNATLTRDVLTVVNKTVGNTTLFANRTVSESYVAEVDREWTTGNRNFDNTYNALLTLFTVSTLDDWGTVMFRVIDSRGPGLGPSTNNQPAFGLFFVVFIIIGVFFILNMFVGVIIFNFTVVREQLDGLSLLTQEQKLWVETQRMMLNFRPTASRRHGDWRLSRMSFAIAESGAFEIATGVVVLLNVAFIAMEHYGQTDQFTTAMYFANVVFIAAFIVEASIKMFAYGFRYFWDGWNRFDFFLIIIGIVDIAADGLFPINFSLLRVLRIFRIMRMLALVKRAKEVRVLLETLWYSLPSLANIGALFILIFFIYAVLGMQLFATVKRRDGLTSDTNFETFENSFLFLIQLTTMDNWGTVMFATMNVDDCGPSTNTKGWDDCGVVYAPIYYVTFIILSAFVMVNLFIAIIIDNFNITQQLNHSALKLAHLKKFGDVWQKFDPDATMLMETRLFPNLLMGLQPPLGITRATDRATLMSLADEYRIVEHGGLVHFVEVMVPMARKVLGVSFSDAELRSHEDHWREQFPSLAELKILRYKMRRVTVDQYFGATFLAAAFRRRSAYRHANKLRNNKMDLLKKYYDEHNTPEEERGALVRMRREEEARADNGNFTFDTANPHNHRMSSILGSGSGAGSVENTPGPPDELDNTLANGLGRTYPNRPQSGRNFGRNSSEDELDRTARHPPLGRQQIGSLIGIGR